MSILLDDDFQSYAVGANPPYGNLYTGNIVAPIIVNSPLGVYGDAKSVQMPSLNGALFWPCPPLSINNSFPAYTEFMIIQAIFVQQDNASSLGPLLVFNSYLNPFNGFSLAAIQLYADGTIGICGEFFSLGQIPEAISDFSLLQGKWYLIQTNIRFGASAGVVTIDAEVGVNGVSVVSFSGLTTTPISGLPATYVNAIQLGGAGGGMFMGRTTFYDTVQPMGTFPHPGTPESRVSQGVIELILSPTLNTVTLACPVGGGSAMVGTPYSSQLVSTGGVDPKVYTIVSGALPFGLTLNPDTGIISGTPETSGTFSYTVKVTDAAGATATVSAPCSIVVSATPPPFCIVPQVPAEQSTLVAYTEPTELEGT